MTQVDERVKQDFDAIDPHPTYAECRRSEEGTELVSEGVRIFRIFAEEFGQNFADVVREA
jgi:hypothetical protein